MSAPSQKTLDLVEAQDAALNKRAGWAQNAISRNLDALMKFGRIEIGWRESCGSTDATAHEHRAWVKVVARLEKDGMAISQERVKHGNGYATMKGGFWSSIIYSLATVKESLTAQTGATQ